MSQNKIIENSFFERNKRLPTALFYLIPFLGLSAWLIIRSIVHYPDVDGYYMIHYLYNYDHGFVARGLVGEVLSHLFDNISDNIMNGTVVAFSVALVVASSLCIGKSLQKTYKDAERFYPALILCVLLCIFPFTFNLYFDDIKLDKLLWALTLFAVFLVDRKYAVWLCPVLCIIATMVNPIFLFCSMILISVIMLQELYENKFSIKNIIICAVSYISMIAVGLYGAINEKRLGFTNATELVNYYFARYSGDNTIPYDLFADEWLFDYFDDLITVYKKAFRIYFIEWGNGRVSILSFIFFAVPIYLLISIFWIKVIKKEENKFQKFIFFLCLIAPVVLIPPISVSWEAPKYFTNGLIVQTCLLLYYIVNNNSSVMLTIGNIKKYFSENKLFGIGCIMYFSVFLCGGVQ